MSSTEILSIVMGVVGAGFGFPATAYQTYQIYKAKSADSMSFFSLAIFLVGGIMWTTWSLLMVTIGTSLYVGVDGGFSSVTVVYAANFPILFSNIICVILGAVGMTFKVKKLYSEKKNSKKIKGEK